MRKWLSWGIAVCLFAAVVFQATGQTQPKPMGEVSIQNIVSAYDEHSQVIDFPMFVTLYKDGQAIRTTELRSHKASTSNFYVVWNEVPTGSLEVHFEARGFGRVIKRIIVVNGQRVNLSLDAMDKKMSYGVPGHRWLSCKSVLRLLKLRLRH